MQQISPRLFSLPQLKSGIKKINKSVRVFSPYPSCRFLPNECSAGHSERDDYLNGKKSAVPGSTFNTRPNTVRPAANGRRQNGHATEEDLEAGDGEDEGIKRPGTSTIRRGENK